MATVAAMLGAPSPSRRAIRRSWPKTMRFTLVRALAAHPGARFPRSRLAGGRSRAARARKARWFWPESGRSPVDPSVGGRSAAEPLSRPACPRLPHPLRAPPALRPPPLPPSALICPSCRFALRPCAPSSLLRAGQGSRPVPRIRPPWPCPVFTPSSFGSLRSVSFSSGLCAALSCPPAHFACLSSGPRTHRSAIVLILLGCRGLSGHPEKLAKNDALYAGSGARGASRRAFPQVAIGRRALAGGPGA